MHPGSGTLPLLSFLSLTGMTQLMFLKQHRVGDDTFLDTPTRKIKGSKKLSIFQALTGGWEYSKICLSYKEGSSNLLNPGVNKSNKSASLLGSMGLVT